MNNEHFTFFWSNKSPFSNWHKACFTVKGVTYNCSEQYMMHGKALLFGDTDTALQILQATSPGKQKALGRAVSGFDQQIWEANCEQIVYEANFHKFTQNDHLLKHLLSTAGTTLVEASPVDAIWGIGLAEDDPRAHDRATWRGQNLLGAILTRLREQLLKENIV